MFKFLLLLFVISLIHAEADHERSKRSVYASRGLCPYPTLENGRPRLRQRWKMVRFSCSIGFELVGNRYATCRNGEWDVPIPVCVRNGCDVPKVEMGMVMLAHHKAWIHAFCLPGYTLIGSPVMYCNGHKWNGTTPECVATTVKPKLSCNFEDADLCGWTQDEFHDFDWERINKKTPSYFLFTGPSYDHTYGPGDDKGYYMYIESTSVRENSTARLLSPVYDAEVANNACFVFYYHMFGKDIGGLRVYQKSDTQSQFNSSDIDRKNYLLFEIWGNQNNFWYGSVTPLKNFSEPFQVSGRGLIFDDVACDLFDYVKAMKIVIEGIRGTGATSDIAIDDVAILYGENCTEAAKDVTTSTTPSPVSCRNRCDFEVSMDRLRLHSGGCRCSFICITYDDCCHDFLEVCFYGNDSKPEDFTDTPNELTTTQISVSELFSTSTISSTTTSTTTPKPTTQKRTPPISTTPPIPKTTTTTTIRSILPNTTSTTTTTTLTTTIAPTTTSTTESSISTSTTIYYKTDAYNGTSVKKNKTLNISETPKKSSWSVVLIAIICVGCLCGLVYTVFRLRSTRGQLFIARMRGTAQQDSEVRYLNTDVDDD